MAHPSVQWHHDAGAANLGRKIFEMGVEEIMIWTPAHVNVLGVQVSAIDIDTATAMLEGWIRADTPNYVCITGVHGVMESWRDPALRQIHNAAGMVTPDGMPLVWMAHRLGFQNVRRVYG